MYSILLFRCHFFKITDFFSGDDVSEKHNPSVRKLRTITFLTIAHPPTLNYFLMDSSTITSVSLPPKKRQRVSPKCIPDFSAVDLKVYTHSNNCHRTIAEMLQDYHVAYGILEDLKALEYKEREGGSGIAPNQETRVVFLYSDDEYWVVQLNFATDFVFTMKFSKKGRHEEHLFADPCLYKGYPLKVTGEFVEFPTIALVEGGASWLDAYFVNRADTGDDSVNFAINFGEPFDAQLCMLDVSLDGVLDVLYR
jgi:hypothetical protein